MTKYLIVILLFAATAQAGTFGWTTDAPGGTVVKMVDTIRYVTGPEFFCDSNAVGDSMGAWLLCYSPGSRVKMALWDRSGDLVDTTEERTIPSSGTLTLYHFEFINSPQLYLDTQYIPGVWSMDSSATYSHAAWDTATGDTVFREASVYGAWPASATLTQTHVNYSFRMAVYYTGTVGGEEGIPRTAHGPSGAGEAHSIRGAREAHGP